MVRAFAALRELLTGNKELTAKLNEMAHKVDSHDRAGRDSQDRRTRISHTRRLHCRNRSLAGVHRGIARYGSL